MNNKQLILTEEECKLLKNKLNRDINDIDKFISDNVDINKREYYKPEYKTYIGISALDLLNRRELIKNLILKLS